MTPVMSPPARTVQHQRPQGGDGAGRCAVHGRGERFFSPPQLAERRFPGAVRTLRAWANHKHDAHLAATFLCGDFNIKAGSEGYQAVVRTQEYEDQFLAATSRSVFDKMFRRPSPNIDRYLATDGRIDYIFMQRHSQLQAVSARELFTAAIVTVAYRTTSGIASNSSRIGEPSLAHAAAKVPRGGPRIPSALSRLLASLPPRIVEAARQQRFQGERDPCGRRHYTWR